MKKRIFIITLFALLVFALVGCDYFKDISEQLNCDHDYEMISTTATCTTGGTITYKCSKCGREMTTKVEGGVHDFVETSRVDSTCTSVGVIHEKCSKCDETRDVEIPMKDHSFCEWETRIQMTSEHDGLKVRTCSVCGCEEKEAIKRLPDMDLTYINFEISKDGKYKAKSFEELCDIFNAAILYEQESIDIEIEFRVDDFNAMFDELCSKKEIPFDYKVQSNFRTLITSSMEMKFDFYNIPTKKTPKNKTYVQKDSLNYSPVEAKRSSEYDEFKINYYTDTMEVNSCEQLVYALEHRVKPLPKEGSRAEEIYAKMKAVLRQIINDDMTDYEKVKAIHDWIIMNVTYDQELAELLYEDASDLKSYNGFYLEGVFNDGYAVCEGISKSLCCMANMEGIPCVRVTGHETSNPNGVGHAWNKIYINGHWYIIDATSDGTIIGGEHEVLSYAYFLITDEEMLKKYKGDEYNDLECNENYDVFANTSYKQLLLSSSYSCSNRAEVVAIINYFDANKKDNITIQFEINYEHSGDTTDEIREAFKLSAKSHSYVVSGNIVMLIN